MAMFSKKVLVADEAIWIRDMTGVKRIPWADVLEVRVEKSGFLSTGQRLVIRCRQETVKLPLTPELAERVRIGSYSLGRAGSGSLFGRR
jgi:hypothetical protein